MRIFFHSQKLLSINSHFAKCTTSSKCIRRWLSILFLFIWSLRKRVTFGERNKFKFEVKWYIITHCSRSGWNTYMRFQFKRLHAWKLSETFKAGTIVIWFQSRCWFYLLFTMATGRKKIIKVDQTILFYQVIRKWLETVSNLK